MYSLFAKKDTNIGSAAQTVVCVKKVTQEVAEDWDESMPLPGDIIEGFAAVHADDDGDERFVPAKAKSDLSSQLGNVVSQQMEDVWVKVRRGDRRLKLKAHVVQKKASLLQKKYTIRAASDDRHIAVLGDLTVEQCTELQEMSRRVVNVNGREFNKRGVSYDWRRKVDTYLPDQNSPIISSILFLPLQGEHSIEATTARSMTWFSSAVSSGAPLVFVNIQSEQILTSKETKGNCRGREIRWGRQQNHSSTNIQIIQGIRLWFLPGVTELQFELVPDLGEVRFGVDIKRTEEGFFCVYSVTRGLAADRAGLGSLSEVANASGLLLLISKIEGKSLIPSNVCSNGLIQCCDPAEIRDTLSAAIDRMDRVQVHLMAWPNRTHPTPATQAILKPPKGYC